MVAMFDCMVHVTELDSSRHSNSFSVMSSHQTVVMILSQLHGKRVLVFTLLFGCAALTMSSLLHVYFSVVWVRRRRQVDRAQRLFTLDTPFEPQGQVRYACFAIWL